MPAAPLVGAVTTRPPAAFSSFTASAYRVTHSIAYSGSAVSDVRSSVSRSARARRRTFSPPGSTPSARQPRCTHSCIAGPDPQQPGVDLRLVSAHQLVGQHDAADRQAGAGGLREQLRSARERIGNGGRVGDQSRAARLVLAEYESAADRVVGTRADFRARGIEGREPHAVGVKLQPLAAVQHDVVVRAEADRAAAGQRQRAGAAHLLHQRISQRRVDCLRFLAPPGRARPP